MILRRFNFKNSEFELTRKDTLHFPMKILDIKEYDPLLQKGVTKVPYIFSPFNLTYVEKHHKELQTEERISPDFNYGQVQQLGSEYMLAYDKVYRVFFDIAVEVHPQKSDGWIVYWTPTAKFSNYGVVAQSSIAIEPSQNPVTNDKEGNLLYPLSANIYFPVSMRIAEGSEIGYLTHFE